MGTKTVATSSTSTNRAPPVPDMCVASPQPDNSFMQELLKQNADVGLGGVAGKEGAVQSQLRSAYDLGLNAEQISFDGSVYRNVNSAYTGGALDSTRSAASPGMRYNGSGEQLLYGSPSFDESVGEMSAYAGPGNPTGMANRTMVESRYVANPDPVNGTGGVANVTLAAAQEGMTDGLTAAKGNGKPSLAYRLTGENPYSMPQQVGKGAGDAGARNARSIGNRRQPTGHHPAEHRS